MTPAVSDNDLDIAMRLTGAATLSDIDDSCKAFAIALGAQFYEFVLRSGSHRDRLWVSNAPTAWRETGGPMEPARMETVLKRARGALMPVYWDEMAPSKPGAPTFYPSDPGGITSSIVGRVGDASALSLVQLEPYVRDDRERMRFCSRVGFFAAHTHMAALRLVGPRRQALTTREKTCLTLAKAGLTTEGIANALNISGRTVLFHLEQAGAKLQTHGRHNTLRLAEEIGELDPFQHARDFGLESHFPTSALGHAGHTRGIRPRPERFVSQDAWVASTAL